MPVKINTKEPTLYKSKHIAGELSILLQGVERVDRLISELQEISLSELDTDLEKEIKRVQEVSKLFPIISILLLNVSMESLSLVKRMESTDD